MPFRNACPKCWETECECGYEYRSWPRESRVKQAAVILGVTVEELEKAAGEVIPEKHPQHDEK